MRIRTLPIVRDFVLDWLPDDYAGEERIKVSVRQATTNDHLRLSDLTASSATVYDDKEVGRVRVERKTNWFELARFRAFLTLSGCSIEDEDGNALFSFHEVKGIRKLQMSESEFNTAWGKLPAALTAEISRRVLDANPQWDFVQSAEGE